MPHAPGPWAVYDRKTIISESSDSSGDIIAEIWETDDQDWDETVVAANARLIAAAPELLEACRLLMRAEPMQQGERNGAIMGRISTAIDAARAALEKATGKSK